MGREAELIDVCDGHVRGRAQWHGADQNLRFTQRVYEEQLVSGEVTSQRGGCLGRHVVGASRGDQGYSGLRC